jgi:hypothetical protein
MSPADIAEIAVCVAMAKALAAAMVRIKCDAQVDDG